MNKYIKMAAPALVLVAAVGTVLVLSAAKAEPEKKIDPPRTISMKVENVVERDVMLAVEAQGEVSARTEIDLIPQVSGRIIAVSPSFADGGRFKAGETLIQIDDSDYKLAVIRAEARVAEARVRVEQELADARIKTKQWKDWVQDGEPTPLALNKPQVAEAQSKFRAAGADLSEAKLKLSRTKISLPFDGRVKAKMAGLGQYVNVGAKLGRVFSTGIVEVKLALTDSQLVELNLPIGYIADKDSAPAVNFKASIGGEDHVWAGKIVRTHAAIDQSTRLIYAVAQVNDPYGAGASNGMPLAVGMFVTADISAINPTIARVMPRLALRQKDQVYVVNDENKLETRTVKVIATSKDKLFVSSGVVAGERVVISPVRSAVDGMVVAPFTVTSVASSDTNN